MTIFKSHQVTLDPEPWEHEVYGFRFSEALYAEAFNRRAFRWSPRPEFEPTRDPEPWMCYVMTDIHFPSIMESRWASIGAAPEWARKRGLSFKPHREQFDTPVNRVLVEARSDSTWFDSYTENAEFRSDAKRDFTPEEIDHAHKVLTRLAAL